MSPMRIFLYSYRGREVGKESGWVGGREGGREGECIIQAHGRTWFLFLQTAIVAVHDPRSLVMTWANASESWGQGIVAFMSLSFV